MNSSFQTVYLLFFVSLVHVVVIAVVRPRVGDGATELLSAMGTERLFEGMFGDGEAPSESGSTDARDTPDAARSDAARSGNGAEEVAASSAAGSDPDGSEGDAGETAATQGTARKRAVAAGGPKAGSGVRATRSTDRAAATVKTGRYAGRVEQPARDPQSNVSARTTASEPADPGAEGGPESAERSASDASESDSREPERSIPAQPTARPVRRPESTPGKSATFEEASSPGEADRKRHAVRPIPRS